jgi:hypothetical protein
VHFGYLTDTSDKVDMPWATDKGRHSLARVVTALMSGTA